MNARAILFASIGLIISMAVTAAWISHDMERIRMRQEAAQAARCATASPTDPQCTPSTRNDGGTPTEASSVDEPAAEPYADPYAEPADEPASGATPELYDDGTYATS